MKITFLGTSHGIPEHNRRGSCTMIEVANKIYFVDMGVMALFDMINLGKNIESIKGVFITHFHGDHSNGIFSLVDLINWYYTSCSPEIYIPDINAKTIFDSWINITKSKNKEISYKETSNGLLYFDEEIKVYSQKTMHTSNSYSYLIENNDNRILFSGDLKNPTIDFPHELCKNKINLAIFEGAHFSATEYSNIILKYDIKNIIFNHYAPWNIPNISQLIDLFKDRNIDFAKDYMEIEL